jgi:hypothetical protein
MSEHDKAAVRKIALEVIADYRDRGCPEPAPTGAELLREMMEWLVCAPVPAGLQPSTPGPALSSRSSSSAAGNPACLPASASRRRAYRSPSSRRMPARGGTWWENTDQWTHFFPEQPELRRRARVVGNRSHPSLLGRRHRHLGCPDEGPQAMIGASRRLSDRTDDRRGCCRTDLVPADGSVDVPQPGLPRRSRRRCAVGAATSALLRPLVSVPVVLDYPHQDRASASWPTEWNSQRHYAKPWKSHWPACSCGAPDLRGQVPSHQSRYSGRRSRVVGHRNRLCTRWSRGRALFTACGVR